MATRTIVNSGRQAVTVVSFDTETPSTSSGALFFDRNGDITTVSNDDAGRIKLLRVWWHAGAGALVFFGSTGTTLTSKFSLVAGTGYLDFRQWGGFPVADASFTPADGVGDIWVKALASTTNVNLMLEIGVV